MRLSLSWAICCGLLTSQPAEAASPDSPSDYQVSALSDARLVYAGEIAQLSSEAAGDSRAPSFHLSKNIDAIAHGSFTVVGLSKNECWSQPKSKYVPSDCGDDERIVISIPVLPDVGRSIALSSGADLLSAIAVGSVNAPSRAGCIGAPEELTVTTLSRASEEMTLSIKAKYSLVLVSDGKTSCGERIVAGDYMIRVRSTNDSLNGGFMRMLREHSPLK